MKKNMSACNDAYVLWLIETQWIKVHLTHPSNTYEVFLLMEKGVYHRNTNLTAHQQICKLHTLFIDGAFQI